MLLPNKFISIFCKSTIRFLGFAIYSLSTCSIASAILCQNVMEVTTATELTEAIECFNLDTVQGSDLTININSNISAPETFSISSLHEVNRLTVNGNGNTVTHTGDGHVFTAENGTADFIDIIIEGSSDHAGIFVSDTASITDSVIQDNSIGIEVIPTSGAGAVIRVFNSTISNNISGARVDNGGSVVLINSTVVKNGVGVNSRNGRIAIFRSTVAFNIAAAIFLASSTEAEVNVVSSLIGFSTDDDSKDCRVDLITQNPLVKFQGNDGTNFVSDQSCQSLDEENGRAINSQLIRESDFFVYKDTGCFSSKICPPHYLLSETSVARSSGDCRVLAEIDPDTMKDQRGAQRGNPCDAGAVEFLQEEAGGDDQFCLPIMAQTDGIAVICL